ncbi:MAG TPA: rhomboid family intramembrane serine protease, partial [Pseudomonadota bacterium]|nr:rhomboid family intramembrane serine protease [Pseudomonadota bacterium]
MELSEPERATARFQAVVSSLLAPGRGAQLFVHGPHEVRLQVGADAQRGVPVLAQVLLSSSEDAAVLPHRLRPLLDELAASRAGDPDKRFYLRIIVVTAKQDAEKTDQILQGVAATAPAAPALQVFQVSSDGVVRSPSSLVFSEVGPALREQPRLRLNLLPEDEFAARCEQAAQATHQHLSQARDFAQLLQTRRTPLTYGLLGLNLALLGLTYLWGGPEVSATLGRLGAAAPVRILAGEWWRLLAATALHGGLAHLMFNSLALWNLGLLLERLLGSARFLSLYVLAGLGGNLLGTALTGFGDFSSSVGASGAICGLLGAAAALGWRPRGELPLPIAQNLKRMAMLNLGLTALVSLQAHVDWRAHLGGALAGAALTFLGLLRPTVHPP